MSYKSTELLKNCSSLAITCFSLPPRKAKRVVSECLLKFKPEITSGHLQIGGQSMSLQVFKVEFTYSKYLNAEAGYIFFDQTGEERDMVIYIENVQKTSLLMEHSFGIEYFLTNESFDYLIAVNWYTLEVVGSAVAKLRDSKMGDD